MSDKPKFQVGQVIVVKARTGSDLVIEPAVVTRLLLDDENIEVRFEGVLNVISLAYARPLTERERGPADV